jgi:ribonucleoside-diphosphate reductase alpha chain
MYVMQNEDDSVREELTIRVFNNLRDGNFYFGSSTMTNAGSLISQLNNCFIGSSDDSIESLLDSNVQQALMSKGGAGIGWDYSRVRASGSNIGTYKDAASGPNSFLTITNAVGSTVDQLGMRKGSISPTLPMWHKDIKEFIACKDKLKTGSDHLLSIFPAVTIPDLFFKRYLADENWTLFSPNDVPLLLKAFDDFETKEFTNYYALYERAIPEDKKEVISAKELWKIYVKKYFANGMPFTIFRDTVTK